jgi:hypothetical protein
MADTKRTQLTRDDVIVHSYDLPGTWHGVVWHVEINAKHYVVSAVDLPSVAAGYKTCETAVFPANSDGTVDNYHDLVMLGDIKDHEAAIAALLEDLSGAPEPKPTTEDFLRWLVRMDDPTDEQGVRDRQVVRLSAIIDRARALLGEA